MAILKITIPEEPALRAELQHAMTVGRAPDCQIRLPIDDISRQHCRFESSQEGWIVVDLGSKNGTFVGKERIERHRLSDGDEVCIGTAKLKFVADGLADQAQSLEEEALEIVRDTAPDDSDLNSGTRFDEPAPPTDPVADLGHDALPNRAVVETNAGQAAEADALSREPPPATAPVGTKEAVGDAISSVGSDKKTLASERGKKRSLWDLASAPVPAAITEDEKQRPESSIKFGVKLRSESEPDQKQRAQSLKWYQRRVPAPIFIAIAVVLGAVAVWRIYIFLVT